MPKVRRISHRVRCIVSLATTCLALAALSPATARANSADPSGAGIPSLPGWTLRFSDDFTGSAVNTAHWSVYNGNPHGHGGPKSAKNAIVHDGMLTLRVTKLDGVWTGAGMSGAKSTTGTYGRFMVRARYSHGVGARATALLWPTTGWPPELDFLEFDARDPDHSKLMLTNHYNPDDEMQQAFIPGDYTEWHTFGVIWTPTSITYTLDGTVTARMIGHVPTARMWLGLANSLGNNVQPDRTTPDRVDFDIDWVGYYVRG